MVSKMDPGKIPISFPSHFIYHATQTNIRLSPPFYEWKHSFAKINKVDPGTRAFRPKFPTSYAPFFGPNPSGRPGISNCLKYFTDYVCFPYKWRKGKRPTLFFLFVNVPINSADVFLALKTVLTDR